MVSKTLNLSRASERLGMTQPALSLAVKRLEVHMNISLLDRGKTGVKLTKAGEKLALSAKDLIKSWETTVVEAQKDDQTPRGRFSIGCHASVGLYTLDKFVGKLLRTYPDLEFDFHHDLSRNITERVISRDLDFGIVINPVSHPDLVIRELAKDKVSFYISTNLKRSKFNPPLILDPDLLQSQELLKKSLKKKYGFSRTIHSSSLEVIKELILSGAGVGILPGRVAAKAEKSLTLWDEKAPFYSDSICFIYRPETIRSGAAKLLKDVMLEELGKI